MSDDSDYSKELEIDPNQLDIEWLRQPKLYFKYAQEAASAREQVDTVKLQLDITLAQVMQEVRSNPEGFGIAKVTEAAIDAAVKQDKRVITKQQKLIEEKNNAEVLRAAVDSFDQRKCALENLVKLHLGSYFAGPKEPRQLDKSMIDEMRSDRAKQKIHKTLNRE